MGTDKKPKGASTAEADQTSGLIAVIEELKAKVIEQQELIDRLMQNPTPYMTVVAVVCKKQKDGKEETIAVTWTNNQYLQIPLPEDQKGKVAPGQTIRVSAGTLQFIEKIDNLADFVSGKIHTIRKVVSDRLVEIDDQDSSRAVANYLEVKPKIGDRILLDPSGHVILKNLGKEDKQFVWTEETNVTWDDIGGHERAKEELIEAIVLPSKHPEIYAKYGKKRTKGMLLYGKPGNGKTLLAKALATEVAKVFGAKSSRGFMYVKGPELLNKWVGESERLIRDLFQRSRDHFKEHGYPAVVFIDEADAVLQTRGSRKTGDMEMTIVPQFLSEMDGMDDSGAFILLATNRPDTIDPAILRDGRIDRKVEIKRPTLDMAKGIFKIHLRGRPLADGADIEDFAVASAEAMYDAGNALVKVEKKSGEVVNFTLGHVASGAMIAGVVERATSAALKRDLKAESFKGITPENMTQAIEETLSEQKSLDFKDDLDNFTEPWRGDVKKVLKV